MRSPHAPSRPTVRNARPSDARALVALQRGIYREVRWFVGDGPPGVDTLTRRLRSHDPTMSLYLVVDADEADTRAGDGPGISAWLELHRLQPERLRHVAVLTLAVASGQRRRGLGRALLRRAYRWAGRTGVRKITLNVRANNLSALTLYRSEGFELEGRERDHIRDEDGFEDNLIMAKFLGAHGGPRD